MAFNVNNLGETVSYELFRVHWFRSREYPAGVLDLRVVVDTTERGLVSELSCFGVTDQASYAGTWCNHNIQHRVYYH